MIIGTGVDIVDLSRVRRIFETYGMRFARRILAASERDEARHITVELLGSRLAAKEACVKALGTGFTRGIGMHDVAVRSLASGKPELVLSRGARETADRLGLRASHLSLSHERHLAVAMVVLEI
jgi:holo-[acyl-carrier protein] synthase